MIDLQDIRDDLNWKGPSRDVDAKLAYSLLSEPSPNVHPSYKMRRLRTNVTRPLCMSVGPWVSSKVSPEDINVEIDGDRVIFIERVVPRYTTDLDAARQLAKDVFPKPVFVKLGEAEGRDGVVATIQFRDEPEDQAVEGTNSNFASALIDAILGLLTKRPDVLQVHPEMSAVEA